MMWALSILHPSPGRETGWAWDLWLQCLHRTNASSEQQNTKKLKGPKVTASNCKHDQLGQIMNNKIQKDQTPNCHFLGARSRSRVRHQQGGQAIQATPLAQPLDPPLPSPFKGPAPWERLRHPPVLSASPSLVQHEPQETLPELLVWPLNNFC